MSANIRSARNTRLMKKLGLVGLAVTSLILAIVLVIAFLPKENYSFSIRIDELEATNHFTMTNRSDGAGTGEHRVTYLAAKALKRTRTTFASEIENYLASVEKLEGSQNFIEKESQTDSNGSEVLVETGYSFALVYTVYLTNVSEEEDQVIKYDVNLDGYHLPDNTATFPLDYFRVLAQTNVLGEDKVTNTYYGNHHTFYRDGDTVMPNDKGDDREAISSVRKEQDEEGNNYLVSEYSSEGNDGYCVSFNDYTKTKHIVNAVNLTIPAGKTIRFTFAGYFEKDDPDCSGHAPQNSYLLLSLHFGI